MSETLRSLEDLCREMGLTMAALADRAGLDAKRIEAIVQGRWTPSPVERDKIARVFNLTRDEIAWGHRTAVQHIHGHGPQFGRSP
jgi:transcriptional regulator with XRE-family HTH domain